MSPLANEDDISPIISRRMKEERGKEGDMPAAVYLPCHAIGMSRQ